MNSITHVARTIKSTLTHIHTKLMLVVISIFFSMESFALKPLTMNVPGLETDDGDPIAFTGNLLGLGLTLALGALGLFLIVMIIVQLLKDISAAREDGKWLNVARTALFSVILLVFVGWLISLAIGLI